MRRELSITSLPLDEMSLIRRRDNSPKCGAVVTFLGMVRDTENSGTIEALDYEAFVPMAERQFALLFDELERRWPVVDAIRLVHRIGVIAVGAPSLWVEIHTPHRAEAFAACQWLIDEMKRVVPIWKRPIPPTSPGSPTERVPASS
jgi:molybdopterin synthase catalytic subunit